MHLLSTIDRYLKASGVPPTRFGRDAVRDPRLVHDLRRGRQPGTKMSARVLAYIADRQREVAR
ncbi:hypothetical protein [Sphingomonas montanisoli]|uniref:Uncharacterized protein n=1 Tax=Sphingomonas montanisoli TaxID=2606412 RepID=A0A5D9CAW3_9SPHN|nr:hypothetical protein [Sphingomonas montanisoli]TZG28859.1 hypothetical protein FYJ91_01575 [Sphingomonas montanisoli]